MEQEQRLGDEGVIQGLAVKVSGTVDYLHNLAVRVAGTEAYLYNLAG